MQIAVRTVVVALWCGTVAPDNATAGPHFERATQCLLRSTTDADKTDLVRWTVAAATLHPDLVGMTAVTDMQRDNANKAVARLFERLLTDSCKSELLDAIKFEGVGVVPASMQMLAQSAWIRVMSHPKVSAFVSDLSKYADMQKLGAVVQAVDATILAHGPMVRAVSDSSTTVLELWGLDPTDLSALKAQQWTPSRWQRLWRIADPDVPVSPQTTVSDGPALTGSYVVTDLTIVFVPATPLKRGVSYTWYFFPGELPTGPAASDANFAWRRANFITMQVMVP